MKKKLLASILSIVLVAGMFVPGSLQTFAQDITNVSAAASEDAPSVPSEAEPIISSETASSEAVTGEPSPAETAAQPAAPAETSSQPAAAPTASESQTVASSEVASEPTASETSAQVTPEAVVTTVSESETTASSEVASEPTASETSAQVTPEAVETSAPAVAATETQDASQALYERILSIEDPAAMKALLSGLTEEDAKGFSAEQLNALEEHVGKVLSDEVPDNTITETNSTSLNNDTDAQYGPSTVIYTVNPFTDVAPFGPPAIGSTHRVRRSLSATSRSATADDGLKMSKTAKQNPDGTYSLQLEAYATGQKIITQDTTSVPTDIILVLDTSGSMSWPFGASYIRYPSETNNSDLYSHRNNGGDSNLWYKLSDNQYVSVYVDATEIGYEPFLGKTNEEYFENRGHLFYWHNGKYQEVTIKRRRQLLLFGPYIYTYTFPDGKSVESQYSDSVPNFGNREILIENTTYNYYYLDNDGTRKSITTSEGYKKSPNVQFYSYHSDASRMDALKSALTSFSDAVAQKAAPTAQNPQGIDHRVAVVAFSSEPELYIGSTSYTNGHLWGTNASDYYGEAFQAMNTANGVANVRASIGALTANGATFTDEGVEMANGIFKANPLKTGEKRNRVVVVFTDGVPGTSGYESGRANAAINQANTSRNTYSATVYAVGIFGGADPNTLGNPNADSDEVKANWFMQNLSNNKGVLPAAGQPGYYLAASNADELSNIFEQISEQVENDSTSVTLEENAEVRDIISPYFRLPEGTGLDQVVLETYACTGESNGEYTWTKDNPPVGNLQKYLDADGAVRVKGFNYKENYVGPITNNGVVTGYRGHKLVIKLNVEPKDKFLGGNDVPTNGANSGIYTDADAQKPLKTFEVPDVNVPVAHAVKAVAFDENVYMRSDVTVAEMLRGATALAHRGQNEPEVQLKKNAVNFGLDPAMTAYVNIDVDLVKNVNGKFVAVDPATDLTDVQADKTFYVVWTIYAKGTAKPAFPSPDATEHPDKDRFDEARLFVWKPDASFADGEAWYGDNAPDITKQHTGTVWKHDSNTTVPENILGTKPELEYTYTPAQTTAFPGGKVNTKNDVNFTVTTGVKKNGTAVVADTDTFKITVNTCSLTITKSGGAAGEPYVFTILKDNAVYTQATIVGNGSVTIKELPVGTYAIQEDIGWSWRCTASVGSAQTLGKDKAAGEITCQNTKSNVYWLNHFSEVLRNIAGVAR